MCNTDILTIEPSAFPNLTYKIKSIASVFSWTDSVVKSVKGLGATCGVFTWTVTKNDGVTAIEPAVFSSVLNNLGTNTIAAYTTDFARAGTYTIQVKVWYSNFPLIYAKDEFDFNVVNPCLTDSLTIDPSAFPTPALTYNIGDTAAIFSWPDSAATSFGSLEAVCGSLTC